MSNDLVALLLGVPCVLAVVVLFLCGYASLPPADR